MNALRLAIPAVLAAGCSPSYPQTVTLSGVVLDGPYGEGEPVSGLSVASRDGTLEPFGEATTDDAGSFTVEVAAIQDFFLEVSGEGWTTALFAGDAGLFDMQLTDGAVWVRESGWVDGLAAEFGETCAAAGTDRVIEGEVRVWIEGVAPQDQERVGNAWVTVFTADGTPYPACYLGEEGEADPDAVMTGPTGRFAVFGVPQGALLLEVAYLPYGEPPEDPTEFVEDAGYWYYQVFMVDEGVASFYPAFVEMLD